MIDCYENCKDLRNGVCQPMKMFCPKKLAEHDKQIKADANEEFNSDSCDNATICPCMDFINKEIRSYSEFLNSSCFKLFKEETTKEERESTNNYIESISKKVHTFIDEQLEEHDKQIKAELLDKFKALEEPQQKN